MAVRIAVRLFAGDWEALGEGASLREARSAAVGVPWPRVVAEARKLSEGAEEPLGVAVGVALVVPPPSGVAVLVAAPPLREAAGEMLVEGLPRADAVAEGDSEPPPSPPPGVGVAGAEGVTPSERLAAGEGVAVGSPPVTEGAAEAVAGALPALVAEAEAGGERVGKTVGLEVSAADSDAGGEGLPKGEADAVAPPEAVAPPDAVAPPARLGDAAALCEGAGAEGVGAPEALPPAREALAEPLPAPEALPPTGEALAEPLPAPEALPAIREALAEPLPTGAVPLAPAEEDGGALSAADSDGLPLALPVPLAEAPPLREGAAGVALGALEPLPKGDALARGDGLAEGGCEGEGGGEGDAGGDAEAPPRGEAESSAEGDTVMLAPAAGDAVGGAPL